jgi:hypothetical protein
MFGLFGKPSHEKFARIVIDAARKAGITEELEFDAEAFLLRHRDGVMHLGNIYEAYCQAERAQRSAILANFVSALAHTKDTVSRDTALENCIAVIREKALFTFMDLRKQLDGVSPPTPVFEPISQWFVRALVIDAPGFMQLVSSDDLKEWDLSFDELYEIGLKRLHAATESSFRRENGYYVGPWKDDYDSSRALLADIFIHLPMLGEPVFCLPNRLTLLVAGSGEPESVMAMLSKAEEIIQSEPRSQNPSLLTYRDGEITDLKVDFSSPLRRAAQRAAGLANVIYYDEQKRILEALHEKTGKDLFVATFTLNELKTGEYVSYSVWPKGAATLLPKTDLIIFVDGDKPKESQILGGVQWDDVIAVADDMLLDTEMFPPRYYVSKFPTAEQLAAMPKHSL